VEASIFPKHWVQFYIPQALNLRISRLLATDITISVQLLMSVMLLADARVIPIRTIVSPFLIRFTDMAL
jgi:hypothetical protein